MAAVAACPGLSRLSWCQQCAEMVPCEEARTEAVWSVLCINLQNIFRRRKGIKQSYAVPGIVGRRGSYLTLIFDLEFCASIY